MLKRTLHIEMKPLVLVLFFAWCGHVLLPVAHCQEQPVEPVSDADKQVLIEVRIWETSHASQTQVDFEWSWVNLDDSQAPAGGILENAGASFNPKPTIGLSPLSIEVLRTSYGRLGMQLRAMKAVGEAQILATPVILTLNGLPASIHTGEKIAVPQFDGGELKTIFKDTGVHLNVTPTILGEYVDMTVDANVALIARYVRPADPSHQNRIYEMPVIANRQIQTKLRVASGQGIFLGGLTEEVEQETVRRVPILSKFPWLPARTKQIPGLNLLWLVGRLFETTDENHLRKELFVEIVPRILMPGELVYWPTGIRPEDRPRILDLYNMGLRDLLPQEELLEQRPDKAEILKLE